MSAGKGFSTASIKGMLRRRSSSVAFSDPCAKTGLAMAKTSVAANVVLEAIILGSLNVHHGRLPAPLTIGQKPGILRAGSSRTIASSFFFDSADLVPQRKKHIDAGRAKIM